MRGCNKVLLSWENRFWDLWNISGPWSQPREWMHSPDQGWFWRTEGVLEACEVWLQWHDVCDMKTQWRGIHSYVLAVGWCGHTGSRGQTLPHMSCCHPLQSQEPFWISPAADTDLWLCPGSKEQSHPTAAAPAFTPQRVHEACGATSPKVAVCLGITMVSLLQTISGPRGQRDPPGHLIALPGSVVRAGAGPRQACQEVPCLEINPAAAPRTPVLITHAPQEQWAAGEPCCSDSMVINKRQEN